MIQKRFLAFAAAILFTSLPLSAAMALNTSSPSFAFTPPSQSPEFPDMVIAILKAHPQGTLFAEADKQPKRHAITGEMASAIGTDLEKIIIAKGFRSGGKNLTLAAMSEKRKSAATLILDPELVVNLKTVHDTAPQKGSLVRITAQLTLAFTEPSTGESLWLKHISVTPVTRNIAEAAGGTGKGRNAAFDDVLHKFYQSMMSDVWNQLNPTDFRVLAIKMVQD